MKACFTLSTVLLLAGSLVAADAKDEVKAAAKKLADSSGYSWKTTTDWGGGGGGRMGGATEGKASKDGTFCLMMTRGDNTYEMFKQGEKGAVKTQDGWQSLTEAAESGGGGGQGNPGRMMARMLQNAKAPAQEATEMLPKLKDLKKEGDAFVGQMTEEGAKSLMTLGRGGPGGGNAPEVGNPRGHVKFWIKDGSLAKYEYTVQGTMTWNNNEREINRTTTVELKDVGTTKLEVPAAAKAKLS